MSILHLLSLNLPITEPSNRFVIHRTLLTIQRTTLELSLWPSQINFLSNKMSKVEFLGKLTETVISMQEVYQAVPWSQNLWKGICIVRTLALPIERDDLCPSSWEVTFKPLQFP